MHFFGKNFTRVTLLDPKHTICKDLGPKVYSMQFFLASGYPKTMIATFSRMEIIQNRIGFIMSNTLLQHHINTMVIQDITNNKILMGLMENTLMVIFRQFKKKMPRLKIYEDISIPSVK